MRKFYLGLLAFTLVCAPADAGRMTLLGAGGAGVVATPTTWNNSDKDAAITLSGGDLIATSGGGLVSVRSNNPHASGKYFYSFSINPISGGNCVGIANASFVLSGASCGSLDAVGIFAEGGVVYVNNVAAGTTNSAATNDVVETAWDLTAELVWVRVNGGNWNNDIAANQNPVGNVGGISFNTANAGPWYAVASMNGSRAVTANFLGTPPTGYTNW